MKYLAIVFALACSVPDAPIHDHGDWCLNHFCMTEATTFTPAGEGMYDLVKFNLERISYATGRFDLTTDPQAGIPVLWKSPILVKGKRTCALTEISGFVFGHGSLQSDSSDMYTQVIYVDRDMPFCPDNETSILHELIHALAPKRDHAKDGTSVFSAVAATDYLDEPALVQLCSEFNCLDFNPEKKAPR